MEKNICTTCASPKATLVCGICNQPLCKSCTQFLDEDTFSFRKHVPKELKQTTYCYPCFDQNVAVELEKYNVMLEKAKNINVFEKTQSKETRLVKRLADPVTVKNCLDKQEAMLRMAFQAAELNYNAIIDAVIVGEKIRTGSYQTQTWSGTAIPANVIEDRLIKDRSLRQSPN